MDDDPFRNYGSSTPTFEDDFGLHLMSTIDRNTTPFLSGREPNLTISPNDSYHPQDHGTSMEMDWINQPEDNNFFNILPLNTLNYDNVPSGISSSNSMQIMHHQSIDNSSQLEETPVLPPLLVDDQTIQLNHKKKSKSGKNTSIPKARKLRKPKEKNGASTNVQHQQHRRANTVRKNVEVVINGVSMDISDLPVPVCTCTGIRKQFYRWGCGGWQSACCTTNILIYPLPMNIKRPGVRISGRKMSQGAFKKVIEKLAREGFNFGNAIDLTNHWCRHGTNKFVTIK